MMYSGSEQSNPEPTLRHAKKYKKLLELDYRPKKVKSGEIISDPDLQHPFVSFINCSQKYTR